MHVFHANLLFGCFVKDVAARGLDLPQVTWIVQVRLPSACPFLCPILLVNVCADRIMCCTFSRSEVC